MVRGEPVPTEWPPQVSSNQRSVAPVPPEAVRVMVDRVPRQKASGVELAETGGERSLMTVKLRTQPATLFEASRTVMVTMVGAGPASVPAGGDWEMIRALEGVQLSEATMA